MESDDLCKSSRNNRFGGSKGECAHDWMGAEGNASIDGQLDDE